MLPAKIPVTEVLQDPIFVNGEARQVAPGTTLAVFLETLGIRGRIAVEIDGEIVPRSSHATRLLQPGERVEIVHAIGGG